ncbi:hypothetical protein BC939DRAFT_446558 [Gamsiella multidivaricata]|uniref:uncharacterized protein n=1 Tax=Gamsiella multidivaricata TaxID=101098 RepID=UPI00221F0D46|nr:uncharacterized protein BC939DRAFT_446558 [Gamsiella multidivaricata]KAI7826498.1 hypothetical protein BC939DRAFT_446558 [Gamsiella multidivaricata]
MPSYPGSPDLLVGSMDVVPLPVATSRPSSPLFQDGIHPSQPLKFILAPFTLTSLLSIVPILVSPPVPLPSLRCYYNTLVSLFLPLSLALFITRFFDPTYCYYNPPQLLQFIRAPFALTLRLSLTHFLV